MAWGHDGPFSEFSGVNNVAARITFHRAHDKGGDKGRNIHWLGLQAACRIQTPNQLFACSVGSISRYTFRDLGFVHLGWNKCGP